MRTHAWLTGCYGIRIWNEKHIAYCANLINRYYIWYGVVTDYQFRNSLPNNLANQGDYPTNARRM